MSLHPPRGPSKGPYGAKRRHFTRSASLRIGGRIGDFVAPPIRQRRALRHACCSHVNVKRSRQLALDAVELRDKWGDSLRTTDKGRGLIV